MLGPTSWTFLGLLIAGVAGLLYWLAVARHVVLKVVAGLLAFAVSSFFGAALVNQYYAYYTTWGSLVANARGSGVVAYTPSLAGPAPAAGGGAFPDPSTPPTVASASPQATPSMVGASPIPSQLPTVNVAASIAVPHLALPAVAASGSGRVIAVTLTGAQSGISRKGFVYLPPQYFQPAFSQTRFPVLELLHGDPGAATGWVYALKVPALLDAGIRAGRIGPMIVVMPSTFSGAHGQDCLDAPGGQLDGTYLSMDVPDDIVHDFRALPAGPHWAIGGLSDGGFCATNLALQHRGNYSAVASMDGFYSAFSDLPVMDKIFGSGSPDIQANDPCTLVLDSHKSLPRFWIMSGSGNTSDMKAAQSFRLLVQTREPIEDVMVNHGQHTPPAWRMAMPSLLEWVWRAISGAPVVSGTTKFNAPAQPSGSPSASTPPSSPASSTRP